MMIRITRRESEGEGVPSTLSDGTAKTETKSRSTCTRREHARHVPGPRSWRPSCISSRHIRHLDSTSRAETSPSLLARTRCREPCATCVSIIRHHGRKERQREKDKGHMERVTNTPFDCDNMTGGILLKADLFVREEPNLPRLAATCHVTLFHFWNMFHVLSPPSPIFLYMCPSLPVYARAIRCLASIGSMDERVHTQNSAIVVNERQSSDVVFCFLRLGMGVVLRKAFSTEATW